MEELKTCFIIMPISDVDGYPVGHFKRVYEYLIKPACEISGYKPIRADNVEVTNYIVLDIIKQIVNADMALCDLSSRNPNVLYELGIRQAFNKPVTLIKDSSTQRIFDISGFRDVEYDESLRVDTVKGTVESIASTLVNTYNNQGKGINSLIDLLSIEPAKIDKSIPISKETELVLQSLKALENKLEVSDRKKAPIIARTNNLELINKVNNEYGIRIGSKIRHKNFGDGIVLSITNTLDNPIIVVDFNNDVKKLILNYALPHISIIMNSEEFEFNPIDNANLQ